MEVFKQENISFNCKSILNLYIVYKTNLWSYNIQTNFALENSSFGVVELIKKLIVISIFILDIVLDLIHVQVLGCGVVVNLVKMS